MFKDVSQGLILRPNLFNFVINDISDFEQYSTIYIYADDNTISYQDCDIDHVVINLENDNLNLINLFSEKLTKG